MSFTFSGLLSERANSRPHSVAVVLDGEGTTYEELHSFSMRVASYLASLGIGVGDRVGILARNGTFFWALEGACCHLGAVLVGLNWRLAAEELSVIAEDADLKIAFSSPEFLTLIRAKSNHLVVVTIDTDFKKRLAATVPSSSPTAAQSENVILQLYSSGTTGRPKGILITNANLGPTVETAVRLYGMNQESVNLVLSPLFHIGGCGYGMTALSSGGTTVLMLDADPRRILETIASQGVTHAFMVPAIIQSVVDCPAIADTDLSSLRLITYGGAQMSGTLLLRAVDTLGCDFMAVYGLTETAGTVAALLPEEHVASGPRTALLGSIGRGLTWASEIELRDPLTTDLVSVGEAGEIWVKSPQNSPGYWKQPEVTAESFTEDGWLRTGDVAYRDREGYLFLRDRLKDMVISGGENVYPAEVENVLSTHPSVHEVAVIGVPSARWGETVKAIVVLKPDVQISEAQLIAYTRDRLAHYKCPTSVDFADSLPRNAMGKVLKKELRTPYWTGI